MPHAAQFSFDPATPLRFRLAVHWRYTRAVIRRFRGRLLLLALLLATGGVMFKCLWPGRDITFLQGLYYTQLNEHPQLSVIALRRTGHATKVFPHFKDVVHVGDTLIVQTLYTELGRWHEMNADTGY